MRYGLRRRLPRVSVRFEPRDFWVGVYWKLTRGPNGGALRWPTALTVYVCFVPMLPIVLHWSDVRIGR